MRIADSAHRRRPKARRSPSGAVAVVGIAVLSAACSSPGTAPDQTQPPVAPVTGTTVVLVHGAWADTSSWDGEFTDLYLKKDVFIHDFGGDLPADVATRLWASQRVASTAAFDTPATAAAWKSIPSWYFISSGDQIITPTSETSMAQRVHSHITDFPGGSHLTLISHPEAVTAVIESAAESLR